MPKKFVTIMDITSSKINVIVGTLGVNNTFLVRGKGESEYAGFLEGEFLQPEELKNTIALAISNAEATSGIKINTLYVGVPSEFSFVKCFEGAESFNKKRTISSKEVDTLNSKVIENNLIKDKTIISSTPIWYLLDDKRFTFNAPYSVKASKLKIRLSLVYIENKFIKLINSILSKIGVKSVEYISTPLAEAKYLLSKFERDKGAIIIDSDYISTSVIEVWGNGLMALNTFSMGGGHITGDLSETFGLSFSSAESLKNKIIMSVRSKRMDYYEVFAEDKTLPVPINSANEVVANRINMMADLVKKCLEKNKEENLEINSVYLTGSGLSYINGAREYLAKCLGLNVNLITPSIPSMAKPNFSSQLSVLYVALKEKNDSKINWLKKVFRM